MRTANSALALRYKALLVHKAFLAHKVQPVLRVHLGRRIQLAQSVHKALLAHKAQQEQWGRKDHKAQQVPKVPPDPSRLAQWSCYL